MASPTYTARAIVLRKTKLKESDLIFTLLDDQGAQRRVVAKGARKPTSSFSSRMELFSEVDVLCAEGRSLGILKEVRLVAGHGRLRDSLEHATAAAPMAELLARVTQEDLAEPRLFQATSVALGALERAQVPEAPAITAAHLLKALAFSGFRPQLGACALCGAPLPPGEGGSALRLSFREGGLVCPACRGLTESAPVEASSVEAARFLLGSTFEAALASPPPVGCSFGALRIVQGLVREHVGARLKSLEFLLGCALF